MYLSQLQLNLASRQVNHDLANPYEMHRTLSRAFASYNRDTERILFRVEGDHLERILVQSTLAPDWSPLLEGSRYLTSVPQVKEFAEFPFSDGQMLRFYLRANPVRRDSQSRDRLALVKDEQRIAWLERKGRENGFFVAEYQVISHNAAWREFTVPDKKLGRKQATLNMVDFEGILTVTNGALLNQAIRNGIGPAKGFGCGMLSVARA